MNLDALRVQRYKAKKEEGNMVQRSIATATSQAGEDRNKQGPGDCSKPRPVKNAGLQQA